MAQDRSSPPSIWHRTKLVSFSIAALIVAASASGQSLQFSGEPLAKKEKANLSGAACAPDGHCLLVGDEMHYARSFGISASEIRAGPPLYLLPALDPNGSDIGETDAEGIAFADGYFYIVGSHSRNKRGEGQPSRQFVYRIAADALSGQAPDLGSESAPSAAVQRATLDPVLLGYPFDVEAMTAAPGEGRHGLNIEGIAVRGTDMFLGFRGPVIGGNALILRVNREWLFSDLPQTAVPHPVILGPGQGVRDLAAVQGGLLILSGPEMRDLPPGETARAEIFFWDMQGQPRRLFEVPAGTPGNYPEAITVLGEDARAYRVLVLSDGDAGGEPRIVSVPKSGG